jgi:hypothetical protein
MTTMGPLVPDLIGKDLNFVVALFIGIAFGWILEQAGFSTTRKLVGLFYGYDFTVLRVFFTAGVVAMGGVIALEHFGLLDMNLTYINPTFIWSAIVGGLIMGLGFVVGGFCPGTSVCAAAIGKKDAMIFLAGSVLGVLVFAEGYPAFEGLYKAGHWGSPQMFETAGMGRPLFVLLLSAGALTAFWLTTRIEAHVTGAGAGSWLHFNRTGVTILIIGAIIALSGYALPPRKDALLAGAAGVAGSTTASNTVMTVDEFAFRLIDNDPRLQVIDFRDKARLTGNPLPRSVSFTVDNLFEKEPVKLLTRRHMVNVIVANDEAEERRIGAIAGELGYANVRILEGGYASFRSTILEFDTTQTPRSRQDVDTFRFRRHARQALPAIIAANIPTGPVKKSVKRTVGGC